MHLNSVALWRLWRCNFLSVKIGTLRPIRKWDMPRATEVMTVEPRCRRTPAGVSCQNDATTWWSLICDGCKLQKQLGSLQVQHSAATYCPPLCRHTGTERVLLCLNLIARLTARNPTCQGMTAASKSAICGYRQTQVCTSALPFPSYVSLDKSLNSSDVQFPHM